MGTEKTFCEKVWEAIEPMSSLRDLFLAYYFYNRAIPSGLRRRGRRLERVGVTLTGSYDYRVRGCI